MFQSLVGRHILPGVYASYAQVQREDSGAYRLDADIPARLDEAINTLLHEGLRLNPVFERVAFGDARYSH